jgi:DNA-binding TFAR19-related protein (PDSD5 family)
MLSSGMLRRVALVRTDVSEECNTSIIRVARIGAIGTTLNHVVFLSRVLRLLVTN